MHEAARIPRFFEALAPQYDRLNRFLSLWRDIAWRNRLIDFLPQNAEIHLLDIATGTGDVLFAAAARPKFIGKGFGIDISGNMLSQAREKCRAHSAENLCFACGNAERLAFPENTFDAVTIAFGVRNMRNMSQTLREAWRVLRSGGKIAILEFSTPEKWCLKNLYFFYLRFIVRLLGGALSGHWQAYRYLQESIKQFPSRSRFCELLKDNGFTHVQAYPLTGGIVTVYVGEK